MRLLIAIRLQRERWNVSMWVCDSRVLPLAKGLFGPQMLLPDLACIALRCVPCVAGCPASLYALLYTSGSSGWCIFSGTQTQTLLLILPYETLLLTQAPAHPPTPAPLRPQTRL